MTHFIRTLFLTVILVCSMTATASETVNVPVLTYHRFATPVTDSMTITPELFESQLKWLKDNHYTVIPLKTLVDYLLGKGPAPAPKSVVITADDGHKTQYTTLLPLTKKYNIPVTLFIYPSAISNASYALTWDQVQEMQKTGLFDVQGHTYWHPNFNHDKKKLSPADYEKLIDTQLNKSKAVLEKKLGTKIEILAWPFGIYNQELEDGAEKAGYIMAFSIDGKDANKSFNRMAEPRYMVVQAQGMNGFEKIFSNKQ